MIAKAWSEGSADSPTVRESGTTAFTSSTQLQDQSLPCSCRLKGKVLGNAYEAFIGDGLADSILLSWSITCIGLPREDRESRHDGSIERTLTSIGVRNLTRPLSLRTLRAPGHRSLWEYGVFPAPHLSTSSWSHLQGEVATWRGDRAPHSHTHRGNGVEWGHTKAHKC